MRTMLISLMLFFFLCISFVSADEYPVYVGEGYNYNDMMGGLTDTEIVIKYDNETDTFYLRTSDYISDGWIHLSEAQGKKIRDVLKKYFEWEKTAKDNEVAIEKEFPDSRINTRVTWQYGDDWYVSDGFNLMFIFFSQSVDRHQLVITSNKVSSTKNQYIDFELDDIYLNNDHVSSLLEGTSAEAIEKVKEGYEEQKEKEELFN